MILVAYYYARNYSGIIGTSLFTINNILVRKANLRGSEGRKIRLNLSVFRTVFIMILF